MIADPPAPPPPRVLVVDDNRDAADTTALMLRLAGFEAVACYGGPAALQTALTFRPVACLLDLHMPGMDGDELAGRRRGQAADAGNRRPLLVAVTAMSDVAGRQRTAAAGFDHHMVKPVDPAELVGAVAAG